MRNISAIAVLLWAPATMLGQDIASSEREAAFRYAIANGFVAPASNIVVATETVFDSTRKHQPNRSSDLKRAESRAIAKLMGAQVQATAALGANLISCAGHYCATTSPTSVLLVTDSETSQSLGSAVQINLFSSELRDGQVVRTLTNALVKVERRPEGWVGVGYAVTPVTVVLRER
jgi:hypothetical protein